MSYFCQTEDFLLCKIYLNEIIKVLHVLSFQQEKKNAIDTNGVFATIWVDIYLHVEKK